MKTVLISFQVPIQPNDGTGIRGTESGDVSVELDAPLTSKVLEGIRENIRRAACRNYQQANVIVGRPVIIGIFELEPESLIIKPR